MLLVSFVYEAEDGSTSAAVMVQEPVSFTNVSGATIGLTLEAPVAAQPGTLTATIENAVNAVTTPTSLQVEILPREFELTFMPSVIGIVIGTTETIMLRLENATLLEIGEQVPVVLSLAEDSSLTISPTRFLFGRDTDTHMVDLGVPSDATTGSETLQATVADPHSLQNVDFAPAEVQVNVIDSRDFAWTFRSVETREALSTVVVVAGGSRGILLSIDGDQGAVLRGGEFVGVSLSFLDGADVAVMPPELTVTSAAPVQPLTLQAAGTATPGQLVVTLTGTTPVFLMDATVMPTAELTVEVVREFTLAFITSDGEALETARVQAGDATRVSLSLRGASPLSEDEVLTVSFSYEPQDAGVVVSSPTEMIFSESSRTVGLTLSAAVDARAGTLTASASSTLSDTLPIAPTDLSVEILPREFALAFTTLDDASLETVSVQAGGMRQVRLNLLGDAPLGLDEMLTVNFVYETENDGTGADVTVQESVIFSTTNGTVIDLTLEAPVAARSSTLTAGIEDAVNAVITPASLQVEILPREFMLAFTALDDASLETVSVQAGGMRQVRLSLLGDAPLGADETLTVSFVYEADDGSTGADVTVREDVIFSTTSGTAIDLTLNVPVAAQPGTLTATIENAVNVMATPASLQVEILPREFALAFTTNGEMLETAQVQAGATTQVSLTLSGASADTLLGADETLTVSFAYDVEGGSTSDAVMVQEPVSFTNVSSTTIDLTLEAPVAAQPGTLTATIEDAVNAVITPTSLQVEVVPRDFAWTFRSVETGEALSTVVVVAGGSREVLLSLEGDQGAALGEGESVGVSLSFMDGTDVAVMPPELTFTSATPTRSLILQAEGTATAGRLVAMLTDTIPASLANATVMPTAELTVEVVREFALVFTTLSDAPLETIQVRVGATTRVRLSLSGAASLGTDETLTVTFVYDPEDGGVTVEEVMNFTADVTSIDLTLRATADARPGTLTASIADTEDVMVSSVQVPVTITPAGAGIRLQVRVLLEGALQ